MNQLINLIVAIILAVSINAFSQHEITAFKREVISKLDLGLSPLTPFTSKLLEIKK